MKVSHARPCRLVAFTYLILLTFFSTGCKTRNEFYDQAKWQASDYFTDPQVIALCHAIEMHDIAEIDRLVKAGADVNTKGKGNMTPLLWAFPADEKVFKSILEYGGDPNVIVTEDFGTRGLIYPGTSVMEMSTASSFPNHFTYVMDHGGDPNLINSKTKRTPIFTAIIYGGQKERVTRLIEAGADINYQFSEGAETPLIEAAGGQHWKVALMLLQMGADYTVQLENFCTDLTLIIVSTEDTASSQGLTPINVEDLNKVKDYLRRQGVDFQAAEVELILRKKEMKKAFKSSMVKHLHEYVWPKRCTNPPWLPASKEEVQEQ